MFTNFEVPFATVAITWSNLGCNIKWHIEETQIEPANPKDEKIVSSTQTTNWGCRHRTLKKKGVFVNKMDCDPAASSIGRVFLALDVLRITEFEHRCKVQRTRKAQRRFCNIDKKHTRRRLLPKRSPSLNDLRS